MKTILGFFFSIGIFFYTNSIVFAAFDIQLTAVPVSVSPGGSAILSWEAPKGSICSSYADIQNKRGQWVWSLSDEWQASARERKGDKNVTPRYSARYYLSCTLGNKQVQKVAEITVQSQKNTQTPPPQSPKTDSPEVVSNSNTKKEEPASPADSIAPNNPQPTISGGDGGGWGAVQSSKKDEEAFHSDINTKEINGVVNGSSQEKRQEILDPLNNTQRKSPVAIDSFLSAKKTFHVLYKRVASPYDSADIRAVHLLSGAELPPKKKIKEKEKKSTAIIKKLLGRKPKSVSELRQVYALAYANVVAKKDTDRDGLSDKDEVRFGTNPKKKDTDGDGYSDGVEVENNYNPLSKKPEKLDVSF